MGQKRRPIVTFRYGDGAIALPRVPAVNNKAQTLAWARFSPAVRGAYDPLGWDDTFDDTSHSDPQTIKKIPAAPPSRTPRRTTTRHASVPPGASATRVARGTIGTPRRGSSAES